MKTCLECKDGEHPNYDDDVRLVKIIDEETGKTLKRVNMCSEHRFSNSYIYNGYVVEEV